MSVDLTTVSVSLDILTVNAEAGPDTLPLNIQAIEPIAIWTESTAERVPLVQKTVFSIITENEHTTRPVNKPNNTSFYIYGGERDAIDTSFKNIPIITHNGNRPSVAIQNPINVPIKIDGFNTRDPIIQNFPKVNINTSGHTDITATDLLGAAGAFEITIANHENTVGQDGAGEAFFDTSGAHTWTAPAGVTSVSVVAIGGGGGGGQSTGGEPGGCGGGLGWKNNISVTAGQTYNLNVGAAGVSSNTTGTDGGDSYFIDATNVKGGGGGGSTGSSGGTGGTYVGDGGGNGGNGAPQDGDGGGGGGAGGYSGDGGAGGPQETNGYDGSGGGGGGGSSSESSPYNGGGGVNPYGEGTSGVGGTVNTTSTNEFGKGGSGGEDGTNDGVYLGHGGKYGGGGGGSDSGYSADRSKGAVGCVRILWGTNRTFPSTSVSSGLSAGSSTTQVSNPIPVFVENPSHTYSRDETINHIFKRLSINTEKNNTSGSSYNTNEIPFIISQTSAGPAMEKYFDRLSLNTCITYPYGSGYSLKETDIYIKNGDFSGSNIKTQVSERLSIVSETDKSSTSPVFCNSISFSFRIKGTDDTKWGHFTDNHIKTMKVLTKFNDPRLTGGAVVSSGGGGDSDDSGGTSGPVQTWN